MLDVLIVNENQFRDIFVQKLLAEYLSQKNLRVMVVSKIIYKTSIDTLNPKIVIVPRITDDFKDIFEIKKRKKFKLFFIPCEHGAGDKNRILAFIKSYSVKENLITEQYKQNLQLIEKIFVPSDFYKNILMEEKLFVDSQILTTGTINSDLWFDDIRTIFPNKDSKKTIGIATSFKSFMFTSSYESIQKALYTINNFPKHGNVMFESQKHDLFFLLHEMYQFMILSKIISDNQHLNFSMRVHPGENIKNVRNFQKQVKNVFIDRSILVQEWISNQKMILGFSSTMLFDSTYYNVPSYSLSKMIPNEILNLLEEVKKPLNINFLYQPATFDDLYKKLNQVDRGLEEKYIREIKEKIKISSEKNFHFPREKFAFKIIGDMIISSLDKKSVNFFDIILLYSKIFIITLKQIKAANLLFKYKFVMADKIYNPLNFQKRFKIQKFVRLILEKISKLNIT